MKFDLQKSIEILERIPNIYSTYLSGLSEPWTNQNEGIDTWSPYDIVGHMIHGEKTDWIVRAKIILSDSTNKTFTPFDRFAQFTDSQGKSIEQLLQEFKSLRAENISILKNWNLSEKELALPGVHPELGPITLCQLLAAWGVHDLGHIVQISRVMAKQYSGEVGPWHQYLTVLNS